MNDRRKLEEINRQRRLNNTKKRKKKVSSSIYGSLKKSVGVLLSSPPKQKPKVRKVRKVRRKLVIPSKSINDNFGLEFTRESTLFEETKSPKKKEMVIHEVDERNVRPPMVFKQISNTGEILSEKVLQSKQENTHWISRANHEAKRIINRAPLPGLLASTRQVIRRGTPLKKVGHSYNKHLSEVVNFGKREVQPYFFIFGQQNYQTWSPFAVEASLPKAGLSSARVGLRKVKSKPFSKKYQYTEKDYQTIGYNQRNIDRGNDSRRQNGNGITTEKAGIFPANKYF